MMPVQHKISNDPKVATLWKGLFLLCPSLSVYAACPCNDRDICATTTAAATLSLSVCKVSAFSCTRRLLFLHRSSPSPPHVGLQRGKTTLQTASISSSLSLFFFFSHTLGTCMEWPVQRLHCLLFFSPRLFMRFPVLRSTASSTYDATQRHCCRAYVLLLFIMFSTRSA